MTTLHNAQGAERDTACEAQRGVRVTAGKIVAISHKWFADNNL